MTGYFRIVDNYSKALFNSCEESERSSTLDDLDSVHRCIESDTRLQIFFSCPLQSDEDARLMSLICQKLNVHPLVEQFMGVIVRNKRMKLLQHIVKKYQRLVLQAKRIKIAEVQAPLPLSKKVEGGLERVLQEKFTDSDFVISLTLNPKMVGGLMVYVDSFLLDLSVESIVNRICKGMSDFALITEEELRLK